VESGNWWLPAQVKAGAFYGCFNSGLGGLFLLVMDLQALLDDLVCLLLLWGGKNLESILFISPVADL
jgi:hypothetical protein